MRIADLLSPGAIKIDGAPKDKADAINQLVELMVGQGNINDEETYKAAVLAREAEMSTGVENGVAIPHGKSDGVSKPGLAAMTVPAGVDYESLDGEPTTLFFLIAAPNTEDNVHLQVLASLSQLLVDEGLCDKLRAAKSADEFLGILTDAEDAQYAAEQDKKREIAQNAGKFEVLAITARSWPSPPARPASPTPIWRPSPSSRRQRRWASRSRSRPRAPAAPRT